MAGKRKGKTHTESAKQKMRETIAKNGGRFGANNPMYGRKRPDYSEHLHSLWKDAEWRSKAIARMRNGGGAKARRSQGGKQSSIEQAVAKWLDEFHVLYTPQALIEGHCVDFLVYRGGGPHLAVECDGDYWHSLPEQQERDVRQTAALESAGYLVLRFSGSEIRKDAERCRKFLSDASSPC